MAPQPFHPDVLGGAGGLGRGCEENERREKGNINEMFLIISSMMASYVGGLSPVGTSTVLNLLTYDGEGVVLVVMPVWV